MNPLFVRLEVKPSRQLLERRSDEKMLSPLTQQLCHNEIKLEILCFTFPGFFLIVEQEECQVYQKGNKRVYLIGITGKCIMIGEISAHYLIYMNVV